MLTKPPFLFAARPGKAAKAAIQRIQRLMGFNGFRANRAGGSAQTLKSNRFRPGDVICCHREHLE